ncbi:MAG: hypothetical protein H7338_14800, partial [Candidatus Sericytochromatia bacterium]|nr:hypothetical protein [Candidatus Sericytochromatia bacterium]
LTLTGCSGGGPLARPSALSGVDAAGTKGQRPADASDWTVFVYMAADNSLSDFAAADINEMEAGLTTDRVKVVVLVDQAAQGDSRIIEIKHDPKGLNDTIVSPTVDDGGAVIPANKELDTGDPQTLEKFVAWGAKHYPARRTMFVPWNHGGGAFAVQQHLKSFCWDDSSGHSLNLVDFWRVAQRMSAKQKFDIIGFDMCLLGHIETAWQLRDLGDFLVSSEKTEPGDGWDHQAVMRALSKNPTISPRELSAEIVKGYSNFYKGSDEPTAISSMDLQKVKDRLVPAVNALAQDLQVKLGQSSTRGGFQAITQQAAQMTSVGDGEEQAIDLGLMATLITKSPSMDPATKQAAAKVLTELQRATVLNVSQKIQPGLYTGLKIYMDPNGFNADYANASHQSFGTSAWAKLLKSFFKV